MYVQDKDHDPYPTTYSVHSRHVRVSDIKSPSPSPYLITRLYVCSSKVCHPLRHFYGLSRYSILQPLTSTLPVPSEESFHCKSTQSYCSSSDHELQNPIL